MTVRTAKKQQTTTPLPLPWVVAAAVEAITLHRIQGHIVALIPAHHILPQTLLELSTKSNTRRQGLESAMYACVLGAEPAYKYTDFIS